MICQYDNDVGPGGGGGSVPEHAREVSDGHRVGGARQLRHLGGVLDTLGHKPARPRRVTGPQGRRARRQARLWGPRNRCHQGIVQPSISAYRR